ncbi:MAG: DUF177 domain-containing protein [Acidobacteriota bacterium]
MFSLNLKTIRGPQESFERVYAPEQVAVDEDFRVIAPVALAFEIFKDGERFRLAGRVQTLLELPCSRCVESFATPVDALFDLRYQPQAENTGEGELEIAEDDLTTAFYQHDEIDLAQLMREQFYLSLPMKPLCRETCGGLCSVCGTNLNRGVCACTHAWEDPRLAALRELRDRN